MRDEKQLLKDGIKDQLQHAESFVIISYKAFTANSANSFRRSVAEIGGGVEFMRKRILVKAAGDLGIALDIAELPGHIGIVLAGKDFLETTKLVFKAKGETNEAIQVLGGHFEGQLYSAGDVEKLSKLPGINEMRSIFLATLEASMSQTLSVVEALVSSVVYCLDNKNRLAE